MGTSSAYGGPGGGTPLVPSWLTDQGNGAPPDGAAPGVPLPQPLPRPSEPNRFSAARGNFSRFASSGGRDRASLGRAVSHYVSTAAGGSRTAATRMGASRGAGSRLLGFLSDAVARGPLEALRSRDLEHLAGRPVEELFIGLADYVCPDGGTVDEGIARDAFIETIVDLAVEGITDLDSLTADQMQTVFELYATNAIEGRLCNDIGGKAVMLPRDAREANSVLAQLHDFVRRGVADALAGARAVTQALTSDNVLPFVERVYQQAFEILQILGDAEAQPV
ncbi:MAG: Qat anti-phage system associated protein QatB [Bacillota bacterium]